MNKKIRKAESLTAVHTSNLSEKGITLIALVVTIVVLLILAGITNI
jgi:Tfp pilus assembly protein PilE